MTTTSPFNPDAGTTHHDSHPADRRYVEPDRSTRAFNKVVSACTRLGFSVWGSRELQVVGRSTGALRTTPVNLLELEGATFLVAPRGTTQWVRNLRAAGGRGSLRLGRHVDHFEAAEIAGSDKVEVLRAYLRRWKFEAGAFFDEVDASATDAELRAIATNYPAFRLTFRES